MDSLGAGRKKIDVIVGESRGVGGRREEEREEDEDRVIGEGEKRNEGMSGEGSIVTGGMEVCERLINTSEQLPKFWGSPLLL